MARKTFISYKYSDSQNLRDTIIDALGDDATYYTGETAESPDLTDTSTENIKKSLTDMMYGTSVTIVVVSPSIKSSNWIDWEIEYSLKEITRKDRTSKTNGVVGVIQKVDDGYKWLISMVQKDDGCNVRMIDDSSLYSIINKNRYNRSDRTFACSVCRTHSQLDGSYISLVDEGKFLSDPDKYIENAYQKSEHAEDFDLSKLR